MTKFKNKYRIESARAQGWDYKSPGNYFLTIVTYNRHHYFGKIENKQMSLSPIGVIAELCWFEIKNHVKNINLGPYVIMPNHVHGIISILENTDQKNIAYQCGHDCNFG